MESEALGWFGGSGDGLFGLGNIYFIKVVCVFSVFGGYFLREGWVGVEGFVLL